jgi:choice-of-anchor B domain-containing protein
MRHVLKKVNVFAALAGLLVNMPWTEGYPPPEMIRSLPAGTFDGMAVGYESVPGDLGLSENSGPYPSSGVTLMSRVPVNTLAMSGVSNAANDIWGFVSPLGREYAVVGLRAGTSFVDITDPFNPVVVAVISDSTSTWSDMRQYQGYVYNVNENSGGMQIIDVRDIDNGVVTLVGALTQSGLQRSHNIALNVESGYAYLLGSNLNGGSLVAVNVQTPASPFLAGFWPGPYIHDAQIVNYHDGPWAGREVAFCFCGSQGLYIVDVTNKGSMFTLGQISYPNVTYCHQGGLSEDRRHVFVDDELDELQNGNVNSTTTYIINVEDLQNPSFVSSFTNGSNAIDHNLMVRGNFVYQANYTSGLRVYDVSDLGNVQEVGWLDTYPAHNSRSFDGAWGVFVDFPSGVVIVSDQLNGLFVMDPSPVTDPGCLNPIPPQPLIPEVPKNRYLSVRPGNGGRQVALSVTLTSLPPAFEAFEGLELWADEPTIANGPGGAHVVSALRCDPLYRDWGGVDVVHLYGREIMPGATYEVRAVEEDCGSEELLRVSASNLFSTTSLWGDVGGGANNTPDGSVNFTDVSALVDGFRSLPSAPSLPQSDLVPVVPDLVINFGDVSAAVDAFRGSPYNLGGPAGCP